MADSSLAKCFTTSVVFVWNDCCWFSNEDDLSDNSFSRLSVWSSIEARSDLLCIIGKAYCFARMVLFNCHCSNIYHSFYQNICSLRTNIGKLFNPTCIVLIFYNSCHSLTCFNYPCLCLNLGFFLLITYNRPFLRTILHSTLLFLMEARTFMVSLFVAERNPSFG